MERLMSLCWMHGMFKQFSEVKLSFRYNNTLVIIQYVLPLIVLSWAYYRVGIVLRKDQPVGDSHHKKSIQSKKKVSLRVDVRTIQSGAEQGFVDLVDFHIYSTIFHADSRGAIRFSQNASGQSYPNFKFLQTRPREKFITFLFLNQIERGFQHWITHEKLYK